MGWDYRTPGTRICVCFDVTNSRALEVWRESSAPTVGRLTQLFGCGTNCGMCVPYFEDLLRAFRNGTWPPAEENDTGWFGAK